MVLKFTFSHKHVLIMITPVCYKKSREREIYYIIYIIKSNRCVTSAINSMGVNFVRADTCSFSYKIINRENFLISYTHINGLAWDDDEMTGAEWKPSETCEFVGVLPAEAARLNPRVSKLITLNCRRIAHFVVIGRIN